jgi:hypothetical protein
MGPAQNWWIAFRVVTTPVKSAFGWLKSGMSGLLISINLVIEYFALQRVEYDGSFTLEVKKICSHSVFLKGWQTLGYDTNNKKRRIRVFWVPSLLLCMQRWKCHCCFFKSAGPLKRRGIAYISRSSFFNVISCQKNAREYGTRSRLFDSFSLTLFCLLPRVFCATLLNCIQAWNHLERLSFLESVPFFLFVCLFLFTQKCHPKNWG